MVIAISTQWNDNSGQFAYYQIENGIVKQREEALPPAEGGTAAFALQLCGLEVDLLISCPMPEEKVQILQDHGICAIFTKPGNADAVLKDYLDGTLEF